MKNDHIIHKLMGLFFKRYLSLVRRKAVSTVTTYKWVFKVYAKWLDQIKGISFADITTENFTAFWIKEWMAHMTQQGLSDATVCLRLAVIKSFTCFG